MALYCRMRKPIVITLEGNAGCGKSTLAQLENTKEWQRHNQKTEPQDEYREHLFVSASVDYADVCVPNSQLPQEVVDVLKNKHGDTLAECLYTGLQLSRMENKWEMAWEGNCEYVYNDRDIMSNMAYFLVNGTAYNTLNLAERDVFDLLDKINVHIDPAANLADAYEKGLVNSKYMKEFYQWLIPDHQLNKVVYAIDARAAASTAQADVIQHMLVSYVDVMTYDGARASEKIERRLYENVRGEEYKDRSQVQKFASVMPISPPGFMGYMYGPMMTELITAVCNYTGIQGYVFKEIVKRSRYLQVEKNGYELTGDIELDQLCQVAKIERYYKPKMVVKTEVLE